MRSVNSVAVLFLLILSLAFSVLAAGQVDTSFKTYLTRDQSARAIVGLALPDGKILVSIRIPILNGSFVGELVRLNADGTVDTSFAPPEVTPEGLNSETVRALAVQPDGKILIGGDFDFVNSVARHGLARLNADGSLDTTFPDVLPPDSIVEEISLYSDGRILVGGMVSSLNSAMKLMMRLNANGVVDPTFDFPGEAVLAFVVQPDGRIVVGERTPTGGSLMPRVKRYNDNGSLDPTFAPIEVTTNSGFTDIEYLPDGKLLIAGSFSTVNGANRTGIFRANSNGTIDATFVDPGLTGAVFTIALQADGKFFIGGSYTRINGLNTSKRLYRLNPNGGERDTTFSFFDASIPIISDLVLQADEKVLILSYDDEFPIVRASAIDGSRDMTFVRPVPAREASATAIHVLPDNKILVGGGFTLVNGLNQRCLARLNADGTLDTGFAPFFCNGGSPIFDIEVQPDGKVLITGAGSVRRFNTDGSLDVAFPGTDLGSRDVEYLPDGKILVTSSIVGSGTLKRFHSTGTLDTTLTTVAGVQFPSIYKMAVQPDGKIVIIGHFTTVNGTNRNYIARVHADGNLDTSFNAQANNDVGTVLLQADGKILIGGAFTSVNSDSSKKYFARLNSDGSLDSTFSPVLDAPVLGIKIQSDGRILIGGAFGSIDGVSSPRIARINQNGYRDTSFNVGTGPNSTVWSLDQQADGKIVYAGEFTKTNSVTTLAIGRLLNAPPSTFFDYDGDGKADISVFRASENKWYVLRSSDSAVNQPVFGTAGDVPVPADYDGDLKTDVAIFRPSNGQWWYLSSINGSQIANQFGETGDIPRPSDFDGDGKADLILFRPSNSTWYRYGSLAGHVANAQFGIPGDQPVVGDFDADGKSDLAVFRPSNGDWWYAASSAGGAFRNVHWGQNGDLPVPADYDGDSKTDYAVFRPSDGGWYIYNSSNGSFTTTAFGTSGDRPVAADYDGDGRADMAVFRPSTGIWYLLRSTSGFAGAQFGVSTDTPTPGVYVP